MKLLRTIEIENFRCFRRPPVKLQLYEGTYLIGANNSGKTSALSAFRCFFDDAAYQPGFINETERLAKSRGANQSVITIEFDLNELGTGKSKNILGLKKNGNSLKIAKSFTSKPSGQVEIRYSTSGIPMPFDQLPAEVQWLLKSVSVSYLHPQEGDALLKTAQLKLKDRLLSNWGRYKDISRQMSEFQKSWQELRAAADEYLSSALTSRLSQIWPDSRASVDLPKTIEDIIGISQINFKGRPDLPAISLSEQGTGAQSLILYETHFMLDKDRSLHRGGYFPVWLLEEPESFLHSDMVATLGKSLASDEWLTSIQMISSTHSPLILAASRKNENRTGWHTFKNHVPVNSKPVTQWTSSEVSDIGILMGDVNFPVYFSTARATPLIFIEDSLSSTVDALRRSGIQVSEGVDGATDVKKHLEVILSCLPILSNKVYFLIDNDAGVKHLGKYITDQKPESKRAGFQRFKVARNVFIIQLPSEMAAEDLFTEFPTFLQECFASLIEMQSGIFVLRDGIHQDFYGAADQLRYRIKDMQSEDAIKDYIARHKDIKRLFWKKVEKNKLMVSPANTEYIKALIGD